MFSGFQGSMLQRNAFQVVSGVAEVDNGWLGGKAKDAYHYHRPYDSIRDQKDDLEKEIVRAETNIIDLRQREQELRLRQLALSKIRADKQEILRLAASIKFLQDQIIIENRNLLMLQNNMAILILVMSDPFLRI